MKMLRVAKTKAAATRKSPQKKTPLLRLREVRRRKGKIQVCVNCIICWVVLVYQPAKLTDAECIEEEKELDKAQEKIKHAQEELNKLQIREKAKEAEELEKRADTMAETEAEEADDEKLSGEA